MINYGPLGFRLSVDENANLEEIKDMADSILKQSKLLPNKSDGRMILMLVYGALTAKISLQENKPIDANINSCLDCGRRSGGLVTWPPECD